MFIDFREQRRGGERGRGGERERERGRHISHFPTVRTPTENQTCNLGMCPDWELNPQPFWCVRRCSNQLSDPARVIQIFFICQLRVLALSLLMFLDGACKSLSYTVMHMAEDS